VATGFSYTEFTPVREITRGKATGSAVMHTYAYIFCTNITLLFNKF